jgi:hypothetical protein
MGGIIMKKRTITGIIALATTICTMAIPATTSYAEETTTNNNVKYVDYVDTENTCYFSDTNGTVFEFDKIYSIEEGSEFTFVNAETSFCKGVICRPYKGTEKPFYVQDCSKDLSKYDTEGTFTYEGNEYNYKLFPPAKMFPSLRRKILKMIVHVLPVNEKEIARYDYNRNGQIDLVDSIFFNKQISATPFIHCTNLSTDEYEFQQMSQADFFKILDYKYQNGEEEIKICFGDDVPTESTQANITDVVEFKDDAKEETTITEVTDEAKVETSIDASEEAEVESSNVVENLLEAETFEDVSPAATETINYSLNAITNVAKNALHICEFV